VVRAFGRSGQLFIAPAAAQAFMSLTAIGSLLGPPGGMVPPSQLKHDPVLARIEPVPLMYPWLLKYEYAPEAELIWKWQLTQFPGVPVFR
jgi:hypothetical protein